MNKLQLLKNVLKESARCTNSDVCKPVLYQYEVNYILKCINRVNAQNKILAALAAGLKVSAALAACYIFIVLFIVTFS